MPQRIHLEWQSAGAATMVSTPRRFPPTTQLFVVPSMMGRQQRTRIRKLSVGTSVCMFLLCQKGDAFLVPSVPTCGLPPCVSSRSLIVWRLNAALESSENDMTRVDDDSVEVGTPYAVSVGLGVDSTLSAEETNIVDTATFSKSKWKKKRYIMMKDVDNAIHKGDPKAVKKAQDMIRRMKKLNQSTEIDDYMPRVQAYNLLLNALAKSGKGGKPAEKVLKEMREEGVPPNSVSYTSVIDAYARSGTKDAARNAERLLFELLDHQQLFVNDDSLAVSTITCDAVLNAWALQSNIEAAERARLILDRMEAFQNKQIKPTVHSYGTVMNAFARCGSGEAAECAEDLLERMLRQARDNDGAVKPDAIIFNSVIHAWSTSKDPQAGTKAVALLNRMQELHVNNGYDTAPDTVSYNTVLSAWSRCGHTNAAQVAERILQQMQQDANDAPDTAPHPNTVSYNSILHAYSKSPTTEAADRAQAVLEYMLKSNNPNIAPDVYSFTSVLNALAKSKLPGKTARARELLDTLLELHRTTNRRGLKPTVVPFNTVLNAAAFSAQGTTAEQQRAALQIAVSTFTQLRKELAPDTISYGNLLKVVANLVPPGKTRNDMTIQIFDRCCRDGLVGQLVLTEICRAVPNDVILSVLPPDIKAPGSVVLRDLPSSWTCNVRTKKQRAGSGRGARHVRRKSTKRQDASTEKPIPIRPLHNIVESSYQSGRDV